MKNTSDSTVSIFLNFKSRFSYIYTHMPFSRSCLDVVGLFFFFYHYHKLATQGLKQINDKKYIKSLYLPPRYQPIK